jgi:hypothetical protein
MRGPNISNAPGEHNHPRKLVSQFMPSYQWGRRGPKSRYDLLRGNTSPTYRTRAALISATSRYVEYVEYRLPDTRR